MNAMDEERVGELYLDLAVDQLNEERGRKASIEQRAVMVISTSGVLISLQFAIATVRMRVESFVVPNPAFVLLAVALVLLIVAAALALAVNIPLRRHPVIEVSRLAALFDAGGDETAPRLVLASMHKTRVAVLAALRIDNDRKARLLVSGLVIELAAIFLVAVAVIIVFFA
jgi:hypothetical protein